MLALGQELFYFSSGRRFIVKLGEHVPFRQFLQLMGSRLLFVDVCHQPDHLTGMSGMIKLCSCPDSAPLISSPRICNPEVKFPVTNSGTHSPNKLCK